MLFNANCLCNLAAPQSSAVCLRVPALLLLLLLPQLLLLLLHLLRCAPLTINLLCWHRRCRLVL
jgi:hypothetical protein